MKMMIYSKPDYALAQQLAYETVQRSQQKNLPLSIKRIIRSFPNLHLQKYSVFAKKRKISLEEVYNITKSEEGCLWMRNRDTYIILYNDAIEHSGRIRFTLAHELGHYLLKHNEKTKKTIMSRYSLSDDEYDIFEKEANYFAKRLLAPIPLVDLYVANWNKIVASSIEYAFDTSYTVANYIIEDLNKRRRNSFIISEGHPMNDNFSDFINKDAQSNICTNCKSLHQSNIRFCSYCGKENFVYSKENYVDYNIERSQVMIYSKIETNENNMPIECPRCFAENTDENHTFCPYCSVILRNYCLGSHDNRYIELDNSGNYEERSLLDQINGACGKPLDGGFRYCPDCGSETSYTRQGFLNDWQMENIDLPF